MSEQNSSRSGGTVRLEEYNDYRIEYEGQDHGWWPAGVSSGATWQDAIHNWIEERQKDYGASYQVISEQPSEDGRDGTLEIQENSLPSDVVAISKVRAVFWVRGEKIADDGLTIRR